jgi:hypothetical protein
MNGEGRITFQPNTGQNLSLLKARFSGLTTRKIGEMISRVVAKPLVLSKRWELQVRSALDFYETARLRDSSIANALDKFLAEGNGEYRPESVDHVAAVIAD